MTRGICGINWHDLSKTLDWIVLFFRKGHLLMLLLAHTIIEKYIQESAVLVARLSVMGYYTD